MNKYLLANFLAIDSHNAKMKEIFIHHSGDAGKQRWRQQRTAGISEYRENMSRNGHRDM
jgi:hypothetical protein